MEHKKYCLSITPAIEIDALASTECYFDTKEELLAAEKACANLLKYITYDLHLMEEYSDDFSLSEWNEGCADYCELDEDDEE